MRRSSFLASQIRFLVASARRQSSQRSTSGHSPQIAPLRMSTPAQSVGRPRNSYSTPAVEGVSKHVQPNFGDGVVRQNGSSCGGKASPPGSPFLVPELAVSLLQTGTMSMDRLADKETGRLGTMLRSYLIGAQQKHAHHQAGVKQERSQALASYLALNNIDPVKRKDGEFEKELKNPLKLSSLLKRSQTPASLFRMINS